MDTKSVDRHSVVIAGCGNIGSRLLQSLARVTDASLDIFGLEPFEAARQLSTERFEDAKLGDHSLSWADTGAAIPERTDLAIVSSDARNRLAALRAVLEKTTPRNIVLEKILFTKPDDYTEAAAMIKAAGSRVWVNTSRNVWPGYQAFKRDISGSGTLRYHAEGLDWNLGSNAIHLLSIVEYLTNSPFTELHFRTLGAGQRDAKRAGYREVMGTLSGRTERGDEVVLTSDPDAEPGLRIDLKVGDDSYSISEGPQSITGPEGETSFAMLHASQLEETFTEILQNGTSDLPDYDASTRLHLLFFDAIAPALGLSSGDEVPVT